VSQICDIQFLTGEAEVMMRYRQDELRILNAGTLVNITFPGEDLAVYQQLENEELEPSSEIYFDQIALVLQKNKYKWEKLVDWVATAFSEILDGHDYVSYYFSSNSIESTKSVHQVRLQAKVWHRRWTLQRKQDRSGNKRSSCRLGALRPLSIRPN
jgi:hypothetical protein